MRNPSELWNLRGSCKPSECVASWSEVQVARGPLILRLVSEVRQSCWGGGVWVLNLWSLCKLQVVSVRISRQHCPSQATLMVEMSSEDLRLLTYTTGHAILQYPSKNFLSSSPTLPTS